MILPTICNPAFLAHVGYREHTHDEITEVYTGKKSRKAPSSPWGLAQLVGPGCLGDERT